MHQCPQPVERGVRYGNQIGDGLAAGLVDIMMTDNTYRVGIFASDDLSSFVIAN